MTTLLAFDCNTTVMTKLLFLFWIVNIISLSLQEERPKEGIVPHGGGHFEDIYGSKFTTPEALAAFLKFNDWNDKVAYPYVDFNEAEKSVLERREAEYNPNSPFVQNDDSSNNIARRKEYRQLK